MSASSVKPRRAPSQHCRDARVYAHATTIIHGMITPTPSSLEVPQRKLTPVHPAPNRGLGGQRDDHLENAFLADAFPGKCPSVRAFDSANY